MRVTALETPGSSKGLYAIVYDLRRWPERTLQHRGWIGARTLYERQATPDEEVELREAWRYLAWRYDSWAALAKDEALYGIDADVERARRFASAD